jgi:hypothetical protein
MYCLFCVVLCIVCEYICVLNYCHRVATQLHLNILYISYHIIHHIISYHIIYIQPKHVAVVIYKIYCFDELFIGCIKTKTVTPSNNIIYKHFTIWVLFPYTWYWTVCCVRHTEVLFPYTWYWTVCCVRQTEVLFPYTGHWTVCSVRHTAVLFPYTG